MTETRYLFDARDASVSKFISNTLLDRLASLAHLQVFRLCKETKAFGKNPHRHGVNMQITVMPHEQHNHRNNPKKECLIMS